MPAATRIKTRGARRLPALVLATVTLAACLLLGGLNAGSAASAPCTTCTTIGLSASNTSIISGQSVNVTVTVTPTANSATPTGSVSLVDAVGGNHGSGRLSNGSVTISATNLTSGSWVLHAMYSGDGIYDSNDSSTQASGGTITITVGQQSLPQTSVSLTADPQYQTGAGKYTITDGQSINFSVAVTNTSTSTTPTGVVTFSTLSGCVSAPCPQVSLGPKGTASLLVGPWTAGTYTVIAMFSGSQYQSSSAQIVLQVNPNTTSLIDTTTTVLANGGALTVDSNTDVNLNATVTQSHLTIPAQGDKVSFYKTLNGQSQAVWVGDAQLTWNGTTGTASIDAGTWAPGSYTIEADFIGFDNLGASSGFGKLSVYQAGGTQQPTSINYVGDATDWAGQPDNIAFELLGPNNVPVGNETLSITVAGQTYTATTDPTTGIATIAPALSLPAGSYDPSQITAQFAGDAQYTGSNGSGALVVNKIPTSTTVGTLSNPNYGASTTLTATLDDTGTGTSPKPIAGETVTLSFGTDSCSGVTAADGSVSCTIGSVTSSPGPYTVTASFAGDSVYLASSGTGPIVVNKIPTTTTVATPTNTTYGAGTTLSATLVDSSGKPLAGKTVTLSFGTDSCTGVTAADGSVSCAIAAVTSTPGSYTVTASFAGDSVYIASSASSASTITVGRAVTSIVDNVTGNFLQGSTVTLSGTLSANGQPLAGKTLTLSFGTASCTSTQPTDATGTATCTVTVPGPTGPTTTVSTFLGDTNYSSATANRPALVYAFAPGGGNFVVGDLSDTGSVYFWGSQWWKQNSLSAGNAQSVDPASFKGFAAHPSNPQCGGTWSTDPGNSTPPPSGPLPAYMAVIVTSQNAKSGSTLSGNIVHIVIVKTDPGYAGDPGHAGTGTVVATVC